MLFSCCCIGADTETLLKLKKASGAAAIIAYRTEVQDCFTNLAEAILYKKVLNHMAPEKAVNLVSDGLAKMGVRAGEGRQSSKIMVCV